MGAAANKQENADTGGYASKGKIVVFLRRRRRYRSRCRLRLLLRRFHSLNCRRKGIVGSDVKACYGGNRFVEILRLGKASEDASDGESTVWLRPFQILHEITAVDR